MNMKQDVERSAFLINCSCCQYSFEPAQKLCVNTMNTKRVIIAKICPLLGHDILQTTPAPLCNYYSEVCGLQSLQEQQQQWTIPDTLLQSNMKDAIAEDFLPAYKVSKNQMLCMPSRQHRAWH